MTEQDDPRLYYTKLGCSFTCGYAKRWFFFVCEPMFFEGLGGVRGEQVKFRFFILLAEFLSLRTDLTKRKFREWKSWEL